MSERSIDRDIQAQVSDDDLLAEIEGQTTVPPGGDPIIAYMWEGFLAELAAEPGLRDILDSFQESHGTGPVSERAGLLRTIFMADVLRGDQPYQEAIPQTYEQWCGYFRGVGRDYRKFGDSTDLDLFARIGNLGFDIIDATKEVQTTTDKRYVSAELAMQADPRFQDGVRWLDIACASQQGQHALALKDNYPIGPVRIVDEKAGRPQPGLQAKVNELLARPSLIQSGIGVDILNPKDQKNSLWARASLRPFSELLSSDYMERYDALANASVPHIEARTLDITDEDEVTRLLDEKPDFEPNLVTLYTFAHQLKEQRRRALAARNVRRIAAPDATLLLQDFAYPMSARPNFLRYYRDWHDVPYKYSMFRRDLGTDQDYWRKQLSFNESHGNILKLSAEMVRQVMSA